jgi:hypothetical protein
MSKWLRDRAALPVLPQPARKLIGVDAALPGQACYRHVRCQAQRHQLGFGGHVLHAAPVALVPDHQPPLDVFKIVGHCVPTLVYVGT